MKVLMCLKDQQAEAGGVRRAAAVVSCVRANVQAELLAGQLRCQTEELAPVCFLHGSANTF